MADEVRGRRHSFTEGRTERTERMVRTTYPDGTAVDSEPTTVNGAPVVTWTTMAGMFSRMGEPAGTQRRTFTRAVVIEASPWTEVVPEDPQHGAA